MIDDPLFVLVVDDDPHDRQVIHERLSSSGVHVEIYEAQSLSDGVRVAQRERVDVVLLDLELPETSGLNTFWAFQKQIPDLPIIILTDTTEEATARHAVKDGAQDCIEKNDLGNPWLIRCLRNAIQRHHLQERLNDQSLRDSLTDLPNRAFLERELNTAFHHLKSGETTGFAVVFIDLDDFKLINDCYGHAAGDGVLVEFAKRLGRCVRASDMVARFGGDEFVILLKSVRDESDVTHFLERLTKILELPVQLAGAEHFLAASVGYVCHGANYDDYKHMLRDADTAMYQAKKAGKSTHRKFSKVMRDDAIQTVGVGSRIRQALENNEFALAYQPIRSLETGNVLKFEALLRWNHPQQGSISPMIFIPHAERTGLIVPLGLWVLRKACAQICQWDLMFPGNDIQVCVNVSPIQVLHPGFLESVVEILGDYGVDGGQVVLEITESTLMENAEVAIEVLQSLRSYGIRISIDDFGTGYSSLAQLHRFRFDCLKIDRSFVRELLTEGYADLLVQTILLLAQSVGLDVVAEGIETRQEADRLYELGCVLGQGFLLGRPMPSDEATKLLLDQQSEARQPSCMI